MPVMQQTVKQGRSPRQSRPAVCPSLLAVRGQHGAGALVAANDDLDQFFDIGIADEAVPTYRCQCGSRCHLGAWTTYLGLAVLARTFGAVREFPNANGAQCETAALLDDRDAVQM
jgi:hypothetical protein